MCTIYLQLSSHAVKNSERIQRDTWLTFRARIFLFFLSSSDPWWDWAFVSLRCWWIFKRPQFTTNVCISYPLMKISNMFYPIKLFGWKIFPCSACLPPSWGLGVWEKRMPEDEDLRCFPQFLPAFLSFTESHEVPCAFRRGSGAPPCLLHQPAPWWTCLLPP